MYTTKLGYEAIMEDEEEGGKSGGGRKYGS
jgi:hypothetical protein